MYSLEIDFQVLGDPMFIDRAERIGYNALPGTVTAIGWQHQYLQQVGSAGGVLKLLFFSEPLSGGLFFFPNQANEINALYGINDHVWQTDGPDGVWGEDEVARWSALQNLACCSLIEGPHFYNYPSATGFGVEPNFGW